MSDFNSTIEVLVEAIEANSASEIRLILADETRLRAIQITALTATRMKSMPGIFPPLAKVIFVETETFNKVVIDCLKKILAGDVVACVQILAKETSNESAAAIVSLIDELNPRAAEVIAIQCQRIYENPATMGIDA